MNEIEAEFSRPVNVERLPGGETVMEIAAEPHEREALARRFDIPAVEALRARVRLRPLGGSRMVRLRARFEAEVVQSCVVTLEPVRLQVAEEFELMYGPEEPAGAGHEISFSAEDEDPPEPIRDGVIDLGEAVAEHLALALDPFPRAPGATLDLPAEDGAGEAAPARPGPFAALAGLRGEKKNEQPE